MVAIESLGTTSRAHGNHNPDGTDVLRVLDYFNAEGKPALVSAGRQDLLSHLVAVDVRDDAVTVAVGELDRERLKDVAFRDVVFDAMLELHCSEVASPDSLEFIVCEGRRQQIAQLSVPLSA